MHISGKIAASHAHSRIEIYYYTGVCNSSTANFRQIQNNFIQALNSSMYNAVCINEPFCKAEFVNVTCGPTTTRRKRDDYHGIFRRSAYHYMYTVILDLTVPIPVQSGLSASTTFAMKASLLTQMAMKIEEEMRSGHYNLPLADMHLESDSFYQDMVEYKCPKGMKSRIGSNSCGKTVFLFD